MKNIGMSKLHHLLFVLLLFALTGCGASNSTTAGTDGNGSIAAKLLWGGAGVKAAKAVASIPAGVAKIRVTVTGAGVPTVRGEFDVITGAGQVDGIYPGNVSLVVQAMDASGAVKYEGFALNVVVKSGPPTDVGTIIMTVPTVKTADMDCIGCHETTLDVTGQNLIADYKQSGHYTNLAWVGNAKFNISGTGCAGCHGPNHDDKSPATSGRCFECHGSLGSKHQNAASLLAGDTNPARYLNIANNNCSACHEPHNPINGAGNQERKDWSISGHGDVNGAAWVHYDFTIRNTCNSCHTAAGFVKAMGNGWTNTTAISTTVSSGKQPLTCNGCHSSNDFKKSVRTLSAAFVAPYTPSLGASTSFPSGAVVGNSQLCIPCHAGLSSGENITALADTSMNNVSFVNSHYMAAAGLMYVKSGYTAFIDPSTVIGTSTYGKSLTSTDDGGAISSTHRKLGTAAMATDSHVGGQGLVVGGPCVTCHMTGGHSWEINEGAFNGVCVKCHTAEGTTTLTAANFKTVFIEEQAAVFQDALNLALTTLLSKYNISYNQAAYPYFYDNNLTPVSAVKDWTRGGTLSATEAKQLMGACFNINLLNREPAAYAHARTYARRLIYDTIDFLDNKTMDMSVGATAILYNPVMYVKGTTATDVATTEAYKYLAGYNRTTGAWNALERP